MKLASFFASILLLLGFTALVWGVGTGAVMVGLCGLALLFSGFLIAQTVRDRRLRIELDHRVVRTPIELIEFENAPTPPDGDGSRYARRGRRTTAPQLVVPPALRPSRDSVFGVPMPMRETGDHPAAMDPDEYVQMDDLR